MQPDFAGHLAQGQRAQRLFTEFQEAGLFANQAAGDLEQGFAARFQALEQPARFLQLAFQVAGVAFAALPDHLFIAAMDTNAGQGVPGQGRAPYPALPPDHAVRHHVGVAAQFADLCAGLGIQGTQQRDGRFDFGDRLLEFVGDAGDAAARQPVQRAFGDAHRQRLAGRVVAEYGQLQAQAFSQ